MWSQNIFPPIKTYCVSNTWTKYNMKCTLFSTHTYLISTYRVNHRPTRGLSWICLKMIVSDRYSDEWVGLLVKRIMGADRDQAGRASWLYLKEHKNEIIRYSFSSHLSSLSSLCLFSRGLGQWCAALLCLTLTGLWDPAKRLKRVIEVNISTGAHWDIYKPTTHKWQRGKPESVDFQLLVDERCSSQLETARYSQ